MFAIVNIKGNQFRVEENQKLYVPKLNSKEGDKITFDSVLMTGDGDKFNLDSASSNKIEATVIKHIKDETVIVFKKKRRKGYKKRNGHRQYLTQIVIEGIFGAAPKKAAVKKEAVAATEEEAEAPKKKVAKAKKEDTQE